MTHIERLRAALDGYDQARDDDEGGDVLDAADELAHRVRELLAEIEHIERDRPKGN